MTHKVFIDGSEGTTGLLIKGLLAPFQKAGQIELIQIPDYRDVQQRHAAFAQADLSILCLPDAAAIDAVHLLQASKTRVIDASSAHRTDPQWTYGFPEMSVDQKDLIAGARLVTNPGCFATGAISILRPLVDAGLVSRDHSITILGASGYTGGGKKLIERYKSGDEEFSLANVFSAYSVNAKHKHIAEIKHHAGLTKTPVFLPHVVNVPRGMIVSVTFDKSDVQGSITMVQDTLQHAYADTNSKVIVAPLDTTNSRMNFDSFVPVNQGKEGYIDTLTLHVKGWERGDDGQISVYALFDNLGKGAATHAVQNMKLMLNLT